MTTERFEKHARTDCASFERMTTSRRREGYPELSEQRPERLVHVARCGFEIVGVTVRSNIPTDALDMLAVEASEQDRMMSALVSVLDPEQKVTFIYEGGGRTPLRWHIVGEASSIESTKEADERLRNIRQALMTVLESRKTFYRFRPISEDAADRIAAVRGKWMGFIQPQGTHVKYTSLNFHGTAFS